MSDDPALRARRGNASSPPPKVGGATGPTPAPAPRQPVSWLVVVRYENWQALRRQNFAVLGFPDRLPAALGRIAVGDTAILYVASKCASLAGCLTITSAKFRSNTDIFDDFYPMRFRTAPEVALAQRDWVKIHGVIDSLVFCRGRPDWRQCFRTTLRELCAEDAATLRGAIVNPRATDAGPTSGAAAPT